MKVIPILISMLFFTSQVRGEETTVLKSQRDKVNYAIGVNLVTNLKQQGLEIDQNVVLKGIQDAFSGGELLLTGDELRKSIAQYQTAVRQKQAFAAKARMTAANESKRAEDAYLAENKTREGVVALSTGLQYRILKQGTGNIPTGGDTVECNIRIFHIDGTEFDIAPHTGKSRIFNVNTGVIKGRAEALKLMPVGSTWELVIPSHLAYGTRGYGREIGPNETLVMELELIAIR